MQRRAELTVIGAGPYGLSVAAHACDGGVDTLATVRNTCAETLRRRGR